MIIGCNGVVCFYVQGKEFSYGSSGPGRRTGSTPDSKRRSVTQNTPMFRPREISALEIAAEQVHYCR